MNIRVVFLVAIIIMFAVGCGITSFSSGGGITLKEACDNGKAEITQKTTAGTIPHMVSIKNNGSKPLVVDKGTILKSKDSQDLVIAEDKKLDPNSNETVNAYCIEPKQSALSGSILTPSGYVSTQIKQIIDSSNPTDLQNATNSQLQIWVIMNGDEIDVYTGESPFIVKTQNIKYYQLRGNLTQAKTDVMSRFNITDEGLQNLRSTSETSQSSVSWIDSFVEWLRGSLNI